MAENPGEVVQRRVPPLVVAIRQLTVETHAVGHVRMNPATMPYLTAVLDWPVTRHHTVPEGEAWAVVDLRTPWQWCKVKLAP